MSWNKTLAGIVFTAALVVPAVLQAQEHGGFVMNGTWDLEFAAPWGVVVWTFELEQDGEILTGASVQGMGTLMLDGTVKGHDIEFVVDLADGPHALTIAFLGTAGAGEIGGTVEFEDGSTEVWSFTRGERGVERR